MQHKPRQRSSSRTTQRLQLLSSLAVAVFAGAEDTAVDGSSKQRQWYGGVCTTLGCCCGGRVLDSKLVLCSASAAVLPAYTLISCVNCDYGLYSVIAQNLLLLLHEASTACGGWLAAAAVWALLLQCLPQMTSGVHAIWC